MPRTYNFSRMKTGATALATGFLLPSRYTISFWKVVNFNWQKSISKMARRSKVLFDASNAKYNKKISLKRSSGILST